MNPVRTFTYARSPHGTLHDIQVLRRRPAQRADGQQAGARGREPPAFPPRGVAPGPLSPRPVGEDGSFMQCHR